VPAKYHFRVTSHKDDPMSFASDLLQDAPLPLVRHPLIIAEIGINHNGDIEIAKQLIDLAHGAGCDLVKFQKRTIEIVYSAQVLDSPRESPWGTTQREQKLGLEFDRAEYDEIDRHCRLRGIGWFASAWDLESLAFLRQYDLPYNKIASAMLTHDDFVAAVASERKTTFVSTGMSSYQDIDSAVEVFRAADCPFVLMHTVAEYPAQETALNLRVMDALRKRYKAPVGYSGHEATMVPSVIAAMLGAVAIERHITLDRAMYGTDQAASLERRGLEMMVGYIRTIPLVLGDGVKKVTEAEGKNAAKLRYWAPSAGADNRGR
jgi:N-acetylneuraminate synthase